MGEKSQLRAGALSKDAEEGNELVRDEEEGGARTRGPACSVSSSPMQRHRKFGQPASLTSSVSSGRKGSRAGAHSKEAEEVKELARVEAAGEERVDAIGRADVDEEREENQCEEPP